MTRDQLPSSLHVMSGLIGGTPTWLLMNPTQQSDIMCVKGDNMQHETEIRAGLGQLIRQALETGDDVFHYVGDTGLIKIRHGESDSMTFNVSLGGKFVAQYVPSMDEHVLTTELLGCVESLVKQHKGEQA